MTQTADQSRVEALRYLEALGKDPGDCYFRTIWGGKANRSRGGKDMKGFDFEQLVEDNKAESVYVVVGNAEGATGPRGCVQKSDCPDVPALFVEWDKRQIEWQRNAWRELGLPEPSMQVHTGGKSIHTYWVLENPLPSAEWTALQTRLYEYCESDTLKDAGRLMRVPGFNYIDKLSGEVTGICTLEQVTGVRYKASDIERCLPAAAVSAQSARPPQPQPAHEGWAGLQSPRAYAVLGRPLPGEGGAPGGGVSLLELLPRELELLVRNGAAEGNRNNAAFTLAAGALAVAEASAAAGLRFEGTPEDLVLTFAARCQPPMEEEEALACLASAESRPRETDPGWTERLRYQLNRQAGRQDPRTDLSAAAGGENTPFRILGWCAERRQIWYQHQETGQITSFKPAAKADPHLHLAPREWWQVHYEDGNRIDWTAACSALIEAANQAGVFAPERIRGRGVWIEGDRVIWHLGDRLEVDGRVVGLADHRSTNIYARQPALPVDRTVAPLSDAEGQGVWEAVAAMGWATPSDPVHLLGWTVLANVGGALEKRPVLQLTSKFGTGKTYTRERVLQPLLAGLALSRSNSSEAGIRQQLKADTLPVLIDESESEDPYRREGHLRLARLSYDGSPTDRGTTHGQAISYAVRSSVALIGINAHIPNPADRSRTVVVGRVSLEPERWAKVERQVRELLTPEAGARLLRRAVTHLPTLRANAATFGRVVEGQLCKDGAARAGDTYGALLAGAYLLVSTCRLSDAEASSWLDKIGWSAPLVLGEELAASEENSEGQQCLAHLLAHEEPWRSLTCLGEATGRASIRQLIQHVRNPSKGLEALTSNNVREAELALGRRGIKVSDQGLVVTNKPEPLVPIYGNTKWRDGGHRARLRDLEGATSTDSTRFPLLGGPTRGSTVPWEVVDRA